MRAHGIVVLTPTLVDASARERNHSKPKHWSRNLPLDDEAAGLFLNRPGRREAAWFFDDSRDASGRMECCKRPSKMPRKTGVSLAEIAAHVFECWAKISEFPW